MPMPGVKEVCSLLEGYNIGNQISEEWIIARRDNLVVPWVEAKTKLPLGRVETRTEYYDGNGESILVLRARPIVDLISIQYTNVPTNQFFISPTALEIIADEGILKAKANFNEANYIPIFARGERNLRIIYTVGFATIPADVAEAVTMLVAERVLGHIANRTGGGNLSIQSFSRQWGNRGKFSEARNDLARGAIALLRKYMTGVLA